MIIFTLDHIADFLYNVTSVYSFPYVEQSLELTIINIWIDYQLNFSYFSKRYHHRFFPYQDQLRIYFKIHHSISSKYDIIYRKRTIVKFSLRAFTNILESLSVTNQLLTSKKFNILLYQCSWAYFNRKVFLTSSIHNFNQTNS